MGGREFTGPRAAISLSDSVVHNVLNDLERKLVDWAPSSGCLGPFHCRPDFVLHIRCYDAATKRLGRLTLCYCFQLTIVARVNCKICPYGPYLPLAHDQREFFLPLLALQAMFGVISCFICVPFPLLPKFLWRGPRWHAPRILIPFLELTLQEPDLKVPFPLILDMLLQLVCEAVGFWIKFLNCRGYPIVYP